MIFLETMGAWQLVIILTILLLGILPTIIALIDILKNQFDGNRKLIWLLIVVLTNIFGAFLYFLIGRDQRIKS